jgi:hypothetical protein
MKKKHIHRSNARKKMRTIIAQRKSMNILATQMKHGHNVKKQTQM